MDIAAKWYASGNLWAGAGVVVAVLAAVAVMWVTLTVGFPPAAQITADGTSLKIGPSLIGDVTRSPLPS